MRLAIRVDPNLRRLFLVTLLLGVAGTGLTGCSGHLAENTPDIDAVVKVLSIFNPIGPAPRPALRTAPKLDALATASSTALSEIAPFFGNLSVVSLPVGEFSALQRQTDCSLTLFTYTYTNASGTFTWTLKSQTPNYEKTIHNNAFLGTTPDKFATGCVDPDQGISSRLFMFLGKATQNGLLLLAAPGASGVVTSGPIINGAYSQPTTQTTDISPVSLVSADLNKDGNPDLVSINSDGLHSSMTVFLGKADGTYQAGVNYALPGANAQYGVLDDLNGDGILDLLVSSDSPAMGAPSFAFSIFIGKGDGTFKPAQTFTPIGTTVSAGTSFITADVNGDGHKDIVTAQGQVFLGNASGLTFTLVSQAAFPPISTGTTNFAPSIVAADFNKDGKVDLATDDGSKIRTYQGKGDGTFLAGPAYATIADYGFLIATDIDGDGNIDLWSGYGGKGIYSGDDINIAYALMGNGDGTFQGAPSLPAKYTGTNLADLKWDGHSDLVGLGTIGNTSVFTTSLGQSNGKFVDGPQLVVPPYVFNGTTTYPVFVDSYVVGNFHGGTIPDLIYLPSAGLPIAGYFLARGNGDGSFQTPTFIQVPSLEAPANDINEELAGVMAADLNHDGKLDLIYTFTDTNSTAPFVITQGFIVQLGNGDGTFKAPVVTTTYSSSTAPTFAFGNMLSGVADVNNDNFPDVFMVIPTVITAGTAQHSVKLFVGKGDGSFNAPTTLALTGNMRAPSLVSNSGFPITVADLNGDGKVDLVAGGSSADGTTPELAIALGNGDGTFQPSAILKFQGFGYLSTPAIADFNGDGKLDVFESGSVAGAGILPGVGDGTFQTIANSDGITVSAPEGIVLSVSGGSVATDLNGDGKPDLIVGSVVLLNKNGSVAPPPTLIATTTTLVASPSTVTLGQSVAFTATVHPASGTSAPTGTVTFLDGTTSLGTGALDATGVATFSTSILAAGSRYITATYGGDANFSGSVSSPLVETVTTTTQVFTIGAPSVNALQVVAGQSTTPFTFTVTRQNNSTQTVTFSCSGLPVQSSCMFQPMPVTLDGTHTSATVSVTISTAANTLVVPARRWLPPADWTSLQWALVFGLLASSIALFSVRRRRLAWTAHTGVLLLVVTSIVGCAGSYSPGSTYKGTPPGTSSVTITGVSNPGAVAQSAPGTVTLTVTPY